jgi:hypothetical protein
MRVERDHKKGRKTVVINGTGGGGAAKLTVIQALLIPEFRHSGVSK